MRMLIAIPAISHDMARKCDGLYPFKDIERFEPATPRNLDVFASELADARPEGFLGINVPHWSLSERGGQGVAGPGLPADELFHPPSIRKVLSERARTYDKWRPYPAKSPLTEYNVDMAFRYAKKRCRILEKALETIRCKTVMYVEHSPASIAHLSKPKAIEVADDVIRAVVGAGYSSYSQDFVIFSPYGMGRSPGFVVSSRIDPRRLTTWDQIRGYLAGKFDDA